MKSNIVSIVLALVCIVSTSQWLSTCNSLEQAEVRVKNNEKALNDTLEVIYKEYGVLAAQAAYYENLSGKQNSEMKKRDEMIITQANTILELKKQVGAGTAQATFSGKELKIEVEDSTNLFGYKLEITIEIDTTKLRSGVIETGKKSHTAEIGLRKPIEIEVTMVRDEQGFLRAYVETNEKDITVTAINAKYDDRFEQHNKSWMDDVTLAGHVQIGNLQSFQFTFPRFIGEVYYKQFGASIAVRPGELYVGVGVRASLNDLWPF
ncbi:MAG: hypothetical protein L0Y80_12020 [Ignavibacteriae bacterium]|nr:hypothetical protein [Ignavibacteriota bacterium]